MKKLELTLFNEDGELTTYTEKHVPAQKLLDFWNMQIDIEKKKDKLSIVEIIEKKVEYVAGLFTHKDVTSESIISGVNSWELLTVLDNLINQAIGNDEELSDPKLTVVGD